MTDAEILKVIQSGLEYALSDRKTKVPTLTFDTTLAQAGIESITVLEIAGFVEEALHLRLPDDALAQVDSVAALLRLVHSRLGPAQLAEGA
jgi:acyl carrier protein